MDSQSMVEHFRLLGLKVKDIVTGLQGVVVCISFDLNGCVQGLVSPGLDKDGKIRDNRWVDTKALKRVSDAPVMAVPTFEIVPGGRDLPAFTSYPSK